MMTEPESPLWPDIQQVTGWPCSQVLSYEQTRQNLWTEALNRMIRYLQKGRNADTRGRDHQVWARFVAATGCIPPDTQPTDEATTSYCAAWGQLDEVQRRRLGVFRGQLTQSTATQAEVITQALELLASPAHLPDHGGQHFSGFNRLLNRLILSDPQTSYELAMDSLAAQLAWHLGLTGNQNLTRQALGLSDLQVTETDVPEQVKAKHHEIAPLVRAVSATELLRVRGQTDHAVRSEALYQIRQQWMNLLPGYVPVSLEFGELFPLCNQEITRHPGIREFLDTCLPSWTEPVQSSPRMTDQMTLKLTSLMWSEQALPVDPSELLSPKKRHVWQSTEPVHPLRQQEFNEWEIAQMCADLTAQPRDMNTKLRKSLRSHLKIMRATERLDEHGQALLTSNVRRVAGEERNTITARMIGLISRDPAEVVTCAQWTTDPFDYLALISQHNPDLSTDLSAELIGAAAQKTSRTHKGKEHESVMGRLLEVIQSGPAFRQVAEGLHPGRSGTTNLAEMILACLLGLLKTARPAHLISARTTLSRWDDWNGSGPQGTWSRLGGQKGSLGLLFVTLNATQPAELGLATHTRDPFGLPVARLEHSSGLSAMSLHAGPPSERDREIASLIRRAYLPNQLPTTSQWLAYQRK